MTFSDPSPHGTHSGEGEGNKREGRERERWVVCAARDPISGLSFFPLPATANAKAMRVRTNNGASVSPILMLCEGEARSVAVSCLRFSLRPATSPRLVTRRLALASFSSSFRPATCSFHLLLFLLLLLFLFHLLLLLLPSYHGIGTRYGRTIAEGY